MAEDSLRTAIESITKRLHDEIETQLAALRASQVEAVEAARRQAEADAEQRWSARVDEVRTEWASRLESEVATARGEAERRMVAEAMRLRVEAEQAAAESAAAVRRELESALDGERQRAAAALTAERERAASEAAAERQRLTAEREPLQAEIADLRRQLAESAAELDRVLAESKADLDRVRAELAGAQTSLRDERRARDEDARRLEEAAARAAEDRVAERQTQVAGVERILSAIRSLDAARSLSQVLSALLAAAAAEAPRVALFVMNGRDLSAWKSEGFGAAAATLAVTAGEAGLLSEALHRKDAVSTPDAAAPPFARLPADRAAMAVPLLVGAQPVAVLYADDAGAGEPHSPASWPEAVQILSRHASVILAHLTAARAADAMRRSLAPPSASPAAHAPAAAAPAEDGNSARRYARLLVSEIKLYNEAAVQMGRQHRDLLARLKPEIDRARQLYAQRISSSVDSRGALFHQELVQTLADGDPALLGGPA